MNSFLTLCSIAAVALAKPQGYNYGSGVSGTFNGLSNGQNNFLAAPTQQYNTQQQFNPSPSGQTGYPSHSGHTGGSLSAITNLSGASSSSGYNTAAQIPAIGVQQFNNGYQTLASNNAFQQQQQQPQQQQSGQFEAPLVHKQFFTIAAQEENDSSERSKHLVIGRPQKNYRVVFIKAPSSNNANVKLSAEYAPKEEKTVIYVLTKKDSGLEVNDIATPAPVQPSKPEVFFIKYKTDDEAQHAQRQIQAEYDKIEGTSEHTDGGIAQTQSVIGILDGNNGGNNVGTNNAAQSLGSSTSSSNAVNFAGRSPTYLPPGGSN